MSVIKTSTLPESADLSLNQNGKIPCIRLYPNGTTKPSEWLPSEIREWFEYNVNYRFGCALFINNICHYPGCVSDADLREFEKNLQANQPATPA